jgi:hypothetical protein
MWITANAESEAGEVIISFFQNTHFKEFTVLCREKLIWLKALSELFQLDMAVKLLPDEVWKMTIVPLDFETGLLHRKTIRTKSVARSRRLLYMQHFRLLYSGTSKVGNGTTNDINIR